MRKRQTTQQEKNPQNNHVIWIYTSQIKKVKMILNSINNLGNSS